MVVVTGTYIAECFKAGDKFFDLDEGLIEILPVARIVDISYDKRKRQTGHGFDPTKNPLIRTVRNKFKSHHLDIFHDRIVYAVNKGIEQHIVFPAKEDSTIIDISTIQDIIVRVTGQVFAGNAAAENKELLEAMSAYSQCIFNASLFYVLFPPVIADFITRHFLSVGKHINVMLKVMTPILDEIKQHEDLYGTSEPADFMHMMLHTPNAKGDMPTTEEVAFWLQDIAFASIHTTSLFTTFALHNLSDRPDIQELLRNEVDYIKQKHGKLVPEAVKDMHVIDSFLRETLRVGGDYIGINHKTMQDTMMSNGTVIPKGVSVGMAVNDAHTDPVIQGTSIGDIPLTEIDPLRFVNRRSKKSTAVGPDLLVFGMGYHACPGRYFAKQEICYLLARLLDQFDVSPVTKSGKRAPNALAMVSTQENENCKGMRYADDGSLKKIKQGIIQLPPEQGLKLTRRW